MSVFSCKTTNQDRLLGAWHVGETINAKKGYQKIHEGSLISFTHDGVFHPTNGSWEISGDTLFIDSSIDMINGYYNLIFRPNKISNPSILLLNNLDENKVSFKLKRFDIDLGDYTP